MKLPVDKKLVERFHILEERVDSVLRLAADLKRENEDLRARLLEIGSRQEEARRRIDALLDRIDALA